MEFEQRTAKKVAERKTFILLLETMKKVVAACVTLGVPIIIFIHILTIISVRKQKSVNCLIV